MYLSLNQKLEIIKLNVESPDKLKAQPLVPNGQVANAKKFLKEIKSAPPVNTRMIRKGNCLIADM